MTAFQTFEVPLVELPRVDEADAEWIGRVCAIFEKLNSTGVELSVYDLLTARLYRYGIRLHGKRSARPPRRTHHLRDHAALRRRSPPRSQRLTLNATADPAPLFLRLRILAVAATYLRPRLKA